MGYCKQFSKLTGSKSTSCTNCKNWNGKTCVVKEIVLNS